MTNSELLDKLHADLKRIETTYATHASVQQIIEAYKNQLNEEE